MYTGRRAAAGITDNMKKSECLVKDGFEFKIGISNIRAISTSVILREVLVMLLKITVFQETLYLQVLSEGHTTVRIWYVDKKREGKGVVFGETCAYISRAWSHYYCWRGACPQSLFS